MREYAEELDDAVDEIIDEKILRRQKEKRMVNFRLIQKKREREMITLKYKYK